MLETRLFSVCLLVLLLCIRTLAGPPSITSSSDSIIYAEDGSSLTISCSAEFGDSVAWYIENIPINPEGGSPFDNEEPQIVGDDLVFNSVDIMRNSGWYTCATANQFGRAEMDFLLIVGEKPVITVKPQLMMSPLMVQPGTRVELPCFTRGLPQPRVSWSDDMGTELFSGGPIQISPITDSLVIDDYDRMNQPGRVTCTATNRFGSKNSTARIQLLPESPFRDLSPPLQSPLQQMNTPIILLPDDTFSLTCINATSNQIQADQLNFRWFQDHVLITSATESQYLLNASTAGAPITGYYCCEVLQNQTLLNTYCISAVVREKGSIDFISDNTSIPTHLDRHVNLLCTGSTTNDIDPPLVRWSDAAASALMNGTDITTVHDLRFSFARIDGSSGENGAQYMCDAANFVGRVRITRAVEIVDTCNATENALGNPGAEEDGSIRQDWLSLSTSADIVVYRNERVFQLNYSGTPAVFGGFGPLADDFFFPAFIQQVVIPPGTDRACISGRLRGSTPDTPGTHTPVIKIAMEPGGFQDDVILPFPASEAWQWVSTEFNSEQLAGAETMLVVLAVEPVSAGASTSASGTAFFDDLTVTFSSTGGGGSSSIVVIAAAAGGGGLLLAVLLLLGCCCCCYCCCCGKKSDAKLMRKMSTVLTAKRKKLSLPRWFASAGNAETGTEGSYSLAQTAAVPVGPMYEEVGRDETSPSSNPHPTDSMIYDANYYIVHQSEAGETKATLRSEQQENVYQSISQSQAEAARKEESLYDKVSPSPPGDNAPIAEGEYLKVIGQVENVAVAEVPESAGYLEVITDKGRTSSPITFHNNSEELLIDPKIYTTLQ